MRRLGAAALLVVATACSPGAEEAREFAGNWGSTDWGIYLSIDGGSATFYEFVTGSCLEAGSGGVRGIDDVLEFDGETLVLRDAGRLIRFSSVEFLPEHCATDPDRSPDSVYDVVVATVEAHHAPGVDAAWLERAAQLRPGQGATADELFDSLSGLLDPLDHPDVRLGVPGEDTWRSVAPPEVPLLEGERLGQGAIVLAYPADDVAYLGLDRVGGFDVDPERSLQVGASIVDRAIVASTVILDLRAADGGTVADALVIASRFVPDDRVVARFAVDRPAGTTDAGTVTVAPLPIGTYAGKLYVLIGSGTTGTAELLAEALRGVDGVKLVGTTTSGSPAPRLVRLLPNGWAMSVANLVALGQEGSGLADGIAPDIVASDALATVAELVGFDPSG